MFTGYVNNFKLTGIVPKFISRKQKQERNCWLMIQKTEKTGWQNMAPMTYVFTNSNIAEHVCD